MLTPTKTLLRLWIIVCILQYGLHNSQTTGSQKEYKENSSIMTFNPINQSLNHFSGRNNFYDKSYDKKNSSNKRLLSVTAEIQVNTYTTGEQFQLCSCGLVNGNIVFAYTSIDADGYGIMAQIFDNSGAKVGAEIQVNTNTQYNQTYPDIACLTGGNFVVTYQSYIMGNYYDIYLQVFSSTGSLIGSETPVNTIVSGTQYYPKVAALTNGGFVVTWYSNVSSTSKVYRIYNYLTTCIN